MKNLVENWTEAMWKEINDAVVKEMFKVRTAQKVFPTKKYDNDPTIVTNEVIDFKSLTIKEGQTKQYVEIYQEFSLTSNQVINQKDEKTCETLARMAAKTLALAEDAVIFQGKSAKLPGSVNAISQDAAGNGLLGEANRSDADDDKIDKVSKPITVLFQQNGKKGVIYGEETFVAVTKGIAKLVAKTQAPKFALFLPVQAYADTFAPPSDASLVTTADRIKPLVEAGFLETVSLPPDRGLLVALAGYPTTIFVGREATTEYLHNDGKHYFFRVVVRIQYVARDPRAFVLLKFPPKSTVSSGTSTSRGRSAATAAPSGSATES